MMMYAELDTKTCNHFGPLIMSQELLDHDPHEAPETPSSSHRTSPDFWSFTHMNVSSPDRNRFRGEQRSWILSHMNEE